MSPLFSIDRTKVAAFIRPLVPNRHFVFLQVADVGFSAEKPEQFVNDGAQVYLFCGEQGETVVKREAGLRAEDGIGSGAGTIGFESAATDHMTKQVEILFHCDAMLPCASANANIFYSGKGLIKTGGAEAAELRLGAFPDGDQDKFFLHFDTFNILVSLARRNFA